MPDSQIARTIDIFTSRLRTLARLLDMAATQWRAADRDPKTLVAARLADDMFPLPYQIVLACRQPRDLATYLHEGPVPARDHPPIDAGKLTFADLGPHIEATIAIADGVRSADPVSLATAKRIDIPGRTGVYLELPSAAYLDDWLIPHFYFHVVTAYDILRHAGVKIGKPDYLAHLGPYLRGGTAGTSGT